MTKNLMIELTVFVLCSLCFLLFNKAISNGRYCEFINHVEN
jgi:hypothetical protein